MPTELPYQSRQETERERKRSWSERWFGPSRERVWEAMAGELGARFVDRTWLSGSYVVAQSGPWEVMLDSYTVSTGKSSVTYTRIRAPFVSREGFRFSIGRSSPLTPLAKLLGAQDIEVGYADFDQSHVIKSNDPETVRRLFANPVIRDLLLAEKYATLRISDDGGWGGGKYPPDVDLLTLQVTGNILDLDHLHRLYRLTAEVLETLLSIRAVEEEQPTFRLEEQTHQFTKNQEKR